MTVGQDCLVSAQNVDLVFFKYHFSRTKTGYLTMGLVFSQLSKDLLVRKSMCSVFQQNTVTILILLGRYLCI